MSERKAEVLMTAAIIACSTSFVFSKMGLSTMGAFNILAARFLLAFMLLFALFGKKVMARLDRCTILGGALVGFLFFLVMSCEMLALKTAHAGTVSLLENLAIILVPLLESALYRIRPKAVGLLCAAIAVGGVAMLALKDGGFRLGAGECIALLAAFLCAVAIITTEHISHKTDGSVLGVLGMGFLGLYALLASFLFESPRLPQTGGEWGIIAALAVVCTGFGYTLQPIARSHIGADRASLFCTLSPVFTTILGAIVLRERTAPLDYVAMLLILGSSLLLYLPRLHRKSRARAVLFDMDGVLVDTEWFYNRRRVAFMEEKGFHFDEIPDLSGSNEPAIWKSLVPDDIELRERLRVEYKQVYSPVHPVPYAELLNEQTEPVMRELHERGVKCAIASSSYRELIDELVEIAGIADVLDYTISGHECSAFKPDPEIYLRAMKALGVDPAECLVIEDSPLGIEAGKRSGARVLALRPHEGVNLDQSAADVVIDNLTDILAAL